MKWWIARLLYHQMIYWYWIYHANTWAIQMSICIGNMLPTIWGVCISWIYMLVLDISCQHLGDECKLDGFCVPFGHRVGECTFLKFIFLLDIWCQQFGEYMSVEYIWYWIYHANTWGMNVSWRVSVYPSDTGLGN